MFIHKQGMINYSKNNHLNIHKYYFNLRLNYLQKHKFHKIDYFNIICMDMYTINIHFMLHNNQLHRYIVHSPINSQFYMICKYQKQFDIKDNLNCITCIEYLLDNIHRNIINIQLNHSTTNKMKHINDIYLMNLKSNHLYTKYKNLLMNIYHILQDILYKFKNPNNSHQCMNYILFVIGKYYI